MGMQRKAVQGKMDSTSWSEHFGTDALFGLFDANRDGTVDTEVLQAEFPLCLVTSWMVLQEFTFGMQHVVISETLTACALLQQSHLRAATLLQELPWCTELPLFSETTQVPLGQTH